MPLPETAFTISIPVISPAQPVNQTLGQVQTQFSDLPSQDSQTIDDAPQFTISNVSSIAPTNQPATTELTPSAPVQTYKRPLPPLLPIPQDPEESPSPPKRTSKVSDNQAFKFFCLYYFVVVVVVPLFKTRFFVQN